MGKRILNLSLIFIFLQQVGCEDQIPKMSRADSTSIRYVALGDSYTICEGANEAESWPVNLSAHCISNQISVSLIANPSRTGWTSQQLIEMELPVFDRSDADVVTLLIGVNDWVQGVTAAMFHENLNFILDYLQSKLIKKGNILLITIPDFGVTANGKLYSGGRDISKGITEFNEVIKTEAAKRNLPIVDIFELSKNMGFDESLVAADGLHPSAKEYAAWEKIIFPVFFKMINVK